MLFALAAVIALPVAAQVPLHDFDDLDAWSDNKDGGNAPEISLDDERSRDGDALRIKYTNSPPSWGNLTGDCIVPDDAVALRFWLYKHSADARAAMHVWLMEADGDAWAMRVPFGNKQLRQLDVGWHEVRMPVSGLNFDPRGPGTRQMTRADRMLIGSNFADLEVTIDSMEWDTKLAATPIPLPTTENLTVERGDKGSIGVLVMADLPDGFTSAHLPDDLASAIRAGGFGATILQPGDVADPDVLTPANFDAIVVPTGSYFPLDAKTAFQAYLRAGGSFLSTDGYAFDDLVQLTAAGWTALPPDRTAADMTDEPEKTESIGMNTRVGKVGDAVTLHPSQIGAFDPQFHLEQATRFAAADGDLEYEFDEPVTGFSACGLIGVNSPVFPPVYRRWIPVLQAFDADGQLRGTALSIMHNFSGEYADSSWAFSGITSGQDIFLGTAARRQLLVDTLEQITRREFLHSLTTDLASYRPGETAEISVQMVCDRDPERYPTVTLLVDDREVADRSSAEVEIDSLTGDYHVVRAELRIGDDLVDSLESAFCVWDESVLASGAKVAWENNYITLDGKPSFLIGTNQTGMMYFSPKEGPAAWDRDFRAMHDHGFHIWRILHFSPFAAKGYEGSGQHTSLDLYNRPERFLRQMDAIVQIAQKHRVAIFLALHDWLGVTLTDEELEAQYDWCRFWADRYKDVPGIFYDIQNEPSVAAEDRPDVVELWNDFLATRYASDEALRAAWTTSPPEAELPNVPLGATTNDWDDARAADRKRFETELLNRWTKANVDGTKAGDPDAVICVGYLPSMPPADKILGVKNTDFSNMHYYGPVDRFPLEFKLIDRRFQGKGFSLGEFGAREAHDARSHGHTSIPVDDSIHRFQTYIHYTAGLGAAFMANWDWKEFDEAIFPWGLFQRSSYVSRPWMHTLEQGALLLSVAEPVYESPEVFIVAPDSHRVGPRFSELNGCLWRAIDLLLDQRVNFGMVNEEDIADLPDSAKALIWPVPYCPADETFDAIRSWVEAGGTLYLSGDISFDRTRKATRPERLAQLNLPAVEPTSPFDVDDDVWERDVVESTVAQGKTLFAPYPLELRGHDSDADVYARFVDLSGVARIQVEPADAPVRALAIPSRDGGVITMLARQTEGDDLLAVTLPDVTTTVELASRSYAFVITNGAGDVIAAESQGAISIDGAEIASASDHFGLASLDGKGLLTTRQLMVLPHQCDAVSVSLPALDGARCYIGSPTGTVGTTEPFAGEVAIAPAAPGRVAVIAPGGQMKQALKAILTRLERR